MNVGPKQDIVGTWANVARDHGLRFGVSYHGTPHRVWDEFLPARYKSDATGPLAGISYDGMQTIADGIGHWWEGMDPQMINGSPHAKNSPCPEFVQQFLLRVQDVIDSYTPDILISTTVHNLTLMLAAGGSGLRGVARHSGPRTEIIAYFYNKNIQAHSGRLEGVVDLKEVPEPVWGTLTRDFEMALADSFRKNRGKPRLALGIGIMTENSLRTTPTRRPH